jgi:hypothetical protein
MCLLCGRVLTPDWRSCGPETTCGCPQELVGEPTSWGCRCWSTFTVHHPLVGVHTFEPIPVCGPARFLCAKIFQPLLCAWGVNWDAEARKVWCRIFHDFAKRKTRSAWRNSIAGLQRRVWRTIWRTTKSLYLNDSCWVWIDVLEGGAPVRWVRYFHSLIQVLSWWRL